MDSGRKLFAALVAAAALGAPATANATVSATVTDDGANMVALTAGTPLALRNMYVQAVAHVDKGDAGSWLAKVIGPDGVAAATQSPCWPDQTFDSKRFVDYRGNGTYTLVVSLFTDKDCAVPKADISYPWTVNASVAISPPAPVMLTRAANSISTIVQQFNFAGNPGASGYEIKWAKGAVLQPDGSLSSPALKDGYVNNATGKVELIGAREPGAYAIVARARYGSYYSPWSPPANFNLIAPFDLSSRTFPDDRGPSYQVRAIVGEPSAGGRVTVAVAKGKKGKKFRTLGKGKVNSKGVFKVRFRLSRGTYRVRYSFKGSSTVAKGTVYEVIKITRRLG
jgi:hypothetical protein